jgi:hypothetical protein
LFDVKEYFQTIFPRFPDAILKFEDIREHFM